MARLQIRWDTTSSVAPKAASTGSAQATEGAGRLTADKPMVIYITADDETDVRARKLEDVGFKDERVAIGAKFFKCIKISAADAADDRLLKQHGKTTPRLIFIKRNYEVVSVLEKKSLSAGRINRSMAKLCKAEFKNSYGTLVSDYAKLLNTLDRLDDVRTKLDADAERYAGNPKKYAGKLKKNLREKAEYDKEVEAWKVSEAKLLELKLKKNRRGTT